MVECENLALTAKIKTINRLGSRFSQTPLMCTSQILSRTLKQLHAQCVRHNFNSGSSLKSCLETHNYCFAQTWSTYLNVRIIQPLQGFFCWASCFQISQHDNKGGIKQQCVCAAAACFSCSSLLAPPVFDVLPLLIVLCVSVRVAPVWSRSIFCNRNISDSRAKGIKLKSLCSIVWHVILIISWVSLHRVKYCRLNSLAHKESDPAENK